LSLKTDSLPTSAATKLAGGSQAVELPDEPDLEIQVIT